MTNKSQNFIGGIVKYTHGCPFCGEKGLGSDEFLCGYNGIGNKVTKICRKTKKKEEKEMKETKENDFQIGDEVRVLIDDANSAILNGPIKKGDIVKITSICTNEVCFKNFHGHEQYLSIENIEKVTKMTEKPILKDFCVEIPHPAVSEALQKVAFESGFNWCPEKTVRRTERKVLCFRGQHITWSEKIVKDILVSLEEAFKRLIPTPIIIGEYEAIISLEKGNVKIGCQTIPKEKVREILEKLN